MSDPMRDLKRELLAAAERQRTVAKRAHPRRTRVLLVAAAVVVSAVVALVIDVPWKSSPGFMERAEAALEPDGLILHYRYVETQISRDFGCTAVIGPNEVWVDQKYPHRFRALTEQFEPPPVGADERTRACRREGGIVEVGRTQDGSPTLQFTPPNTLREALGNYWKVDPDPARGLREAIAAGRAHRDGETEIDGRTVARIRIDCPGQRLSSEARCGQAPPTYVYVDPETFSLVREEMPSGFTWVPGPDYRQFRFDTVTRYLTFEYLPRTKANLALTDIRTQHSEASP